MVAWIDRIVHQGRFRKRYDVINFFARKRGFNRYLEIGTAAGRCIEKVKCAYKVGVDPNSTGSATGWTLRRTTSDDFFASNNEHFDLILIDGLHLAEQVLRDFFHSVEVLNPGGIIVLHDCNPQTETAQQREPVLDDYGNWNGDGWKAYVYIRKSCSGMFCRVLDFDQGVGVIIPGNATLPALDEDLEKRALTEFNSMTWEGLRDNRRQWLNLLDSKDALLADMKRAGIALQLS